MQQNSRYIENSLEIQTLTLDFLQKETLNILSQGLQEFQSKISCIKPSNVCSLPERTNSKDFSIYNGYGGYLYLYLKLYRYSLFMKDNTSLQYYMEKIQAFEKFHEILNEERLLNSCQNILSFMEPLISSPLDKEKQPMISFFMGRSGVLVLAAFLAYYQGNQDHFIEKITSLKKVLEFTLNYKGIICHEMLYGTSGLLYCFLTLQKSFQSCEIKGFQLDFKPQIYALTRFIYFACINKTFDRFTVKFFGEEYLGAAHGLFGVIYVLIKAHELTSEYLKSIDPEFEKFLVDGISKTIEFCLGLQFDSGNFSSTLDINVEDELLQYCHGSAGIIPVLIAASLFFEKKRPELVKKISESVVKAGEDLWTRGLLKKGYNLCHGISGNAYGFLALYKLTKEENWLKKAYVFAVSNSLDDRIQHIVSGYDSGNRFLVGKPDHPFSLMEGLAGHLCLLIDLDRQNIGEAKFPGLEI